MAFGLVALLALLLSAACTGSARSPAAPSPTPAPVTLHVFHWLGSDIGPVLAEIDRRFMAEHPGVTIDSESFQLDSYEQALERRLAVSDPLDVIAIGGPRVLDRRITPDDLLDLAAEPWVARLTPEGLAAASDGAKVYALPLGKAPFGVAYDKDLFARLSLDVPATWEEFTRACRVIKAAGIVPLALANNETWVNPLVPRMMAATAVYEQNPDLDAELVDGQTTFSGSPWRQVLVDQAALQASGCFDDAARISEDQSIELTATGRAAMVLNGAWVAPQIRAGNPGLDLGMFPLPYAPNGQPLQVPTLITPMFAVPASTRYPVQAKQYLEFLARPEIMASLLEARNELPVLAGVAATFDPATQDLLSLANTRSADISAQTWPSAAREAFFYSIEDVLTGDTTVDAFLARMDAAFGPP